MDPNDTAEQTTDDPAQSRDGLQWQTVGPALGLFAASACIAFLRQDPSKSLRDRLIEALGAAVAIGFATLVAGHVLFKLMRIVPSGKTLIAFWVVVMAGWWWFTR